MDDIDSLENVESLCRLCLSVDETRSSIFGVDEKLSSSSVPLHQKIQACLSIKVLSDDKLSTSICTKCSQSVEQWFNYRDSCLKTQEKLQQWLAKHHPEIAAVKSEPIEIYPEDNIEVIPMASNNSHLNVDTSGQTANLNNADKSNDNNENIDDDDGELTNANRKHMTSHGKIINIKTEPVDIDDDDYEEETELLINPLAIVANKIMEPDSTQKFSAVRVSRKKVRRRANTHVRGLSFRKKCPKCGLISNSKTSYYYHMAKHNKRIENSRKNSRDEFNYKNNRDRNNEKMVIDDEEIEDVEEELVSLEQDAPLTNVQEAIIGQLKTFCCYSCEQSFNDRRSTLNHIRQHMPDLRPYTCIACLTEFQDRSIYKLHCGASFECAMKIALVVPKHGSEKYFTCNMCLRSLPNRKELISHLSKHSDRQYEQLSSPVKIPPKLRPLNQTNNTSNTSSSKKISKTGPYRNGDPAYNHVCEYCGMIYTYKLNKIKHVETCKRLPPEERISYRCAHCGMTFLIFQKFQSHLASVHNRKELTCYDCNAKFKFSNKYLIHHQTHRFNKQLQVLNNENNAAHLAASNNQMLNINSNTIKPKYNCNSCSEEFLTRGELKQHRNIHLKMKIFSCTVCRRMFGNSQALKDHMINEHNDTLNNDNDMNDLRTISPLGLYEHGDLTIDESSNANNWSNNQGINQIECPICNKVFANYQNLRRHIRNLHTKINNDNQFNCNKCSKAFNNEDEWNEHVEYHKEKDNNVGYRCNYCKKKFDNAESRDLHHRNGHGITDNCSACDICGKEFGNETSLKIHRGHHFRRDSRLSIKNMPHPMDQVQVEMNDEASSPTAAAAATSSPNKSGRKSMSDDQAVGKSPIISPGSGNLKCRVCQDIFTDVQTLRRHLWSVHCANKPEQSFSNDDNNDDDVDDGGGGGSSSSGRVGTQLQCELCCNIFTDEKDLDEHMKWHNDSSPTTGQTTTTTTTITTPTMVNDGHHHHHHQQQISRPDEITCDICGKYYSSFKALWKHKKLHKSTANVVGLKFQSVKKTLPTQFPCPVCHKVFGNETSMKKHKAAAHYVRKSSALKKKILANNSNINNNDTNNDSILKPKRPKLDFDIIRKAYHLGETTTNANTTLMSPNKKSLSSTSSSNDVYTCDICRKILPSMSSLYKHRRNVHKKHLNKSTTAASSSSTSTAAMNIKEDLNDSMISGNGVPCHGCDKIFSNISNMKQHYTKVHGNGDKHYCTVDDCKEVFSTSLGKQTHEKTHMNILYSCNICLRHMFSRNNMIQHLMTDHPDEYEPNLEKSLYKKADITSYEVEGAEGRVCPICLITYPNIKAMKIHYVKFHENAS